MITKNDLILLLTDLQNEGIDTQDQITKVATSREIPLDVIHFINNQRQLDVSKFYNGLRIKYNNKKSKLYINIVKEANQVKNAISTLSSLLLQINLFGNKLDDKDRINFYKHARAEEISRCLNDYYKNFNIQSAILLLQLIKADLKILENN